VCTYSGLKASQLPSDFDGDICETWVELAGDDYGEASLECVVALTVVHTFGRCRTSIAVNTRTNN
jgi:hypothetical protein